MTIQEYFGDWSRVIDLNEADNITRSLAGLGQDIYPQVNELFRSFRNCPLNSLRTVIIGQSPLDFTYHPYLDILKESVIDFTIPHGTITFDDSLEKWEAQGVLLLNAALSCEKGKEYSHLLLWRPFIKSLLMSLSRYHTGIVYILMGGAAQVLDRYISNTFNHVIHIRHPSWYVLKGGRMPSDVWRKTNSILKGLNGTEIEWYEEC